MTGSHLRLGALAATLALGLASAVPAQSVPLKDVEVIREGIITAGMVLKIDEQCPSLSLRRLRGLNFLAGLERTARDLGYSKSQIDAYLNDKDEETRLRAVALDRLRAKGAVEGDPESFCAVGRAEIAAGSEIGRLLR